MTTMGALLSKAERGNVNAARLWEERQWLVSDFSCFGPLYFQIALCLCLSRVNKRGPSLLIPPLGMSCGARSFPTRLVCLCVSFLFVYLFLARPASGSAHRTFC